MQQRRVEAVIFDWAGTIIDHGCMAPVMAVRLLFELEGVPISVEEARRPMGAHKRDHLRAILEDDEVRRRWRAAHGGAPGPDDVERMFGRFVPLQLACLADHATLIDGALPVFEALRARGIKIGTTTGYTTEMNAINLREAERQGFVPDASVCSSDVRCGRPFPYMCFENAIRLGVTDVRSAVKVDDTVPGIEAGRRAGMWTIGVALSGNEIGMDAAAWRALDDAERRRLRDRAHLRMHAAGADYVVDDVRGVPARVDDIERRLERAARDATSANAA